MTDIFKAVILLPVFILFILFIQGATELLSTLFTLTVWGWIIIGPFYLLGKYLYDLYQRKREAE
jgi:hypothetical protein